MLILVVLKFERDLRFMTLKHGVLNFLVVVLAFNAIKAIVFELTMVPNLFKVVHVDNSKIISHQKRF